MPCYNEKLLTKHMWGWKHRKVKCLAPSHTAFQEQTGIHSYHDSIAASLYSYEALVPIPAQYCREPEAGFSWETETSHISHIRQSSIIGVMFSELHPPRSDDSQVLSMPA